MPNLKIHWFAKNFLWKSSHLVHMVLKELLIAWLSDGLMNQSFCWSNILRVQLRSKWTICKRILATDSKTEWKSRLILWKSLLILFSDWFGNLFISKELTSFKDPLDDVMLHSGNSSDCQMPFANQSFCWSDILRVQLKSNWTIGEKLLASDQSQFDNAG